VGGFRRFDRGVGGRRHRILRQRDTASAQRQRAKTLAGAGLRVAVSEAAKHIHRQQHLVLQGYRKGRIGRVRVHPGQRIRKLLPGCRTRAERNILQGVNR